MVLALVTRDYYIGKVYYHEQTYKKNRKNENDSINYLAN